MCGGCAPKCSNVQQCAVICTKKSDAPPLRFLRLLMFNSGPSSSVFGPPSSVFWPVRVVTLRCDASECQETPMFMRVVTLVTLVTLKIAPAGGERSPAINHQLPINQLLLTWHGRHGSGTAAPNPKKPVNIGLARRYGGTAQIPFRWGGGTRLNDPSRRKKSKANRIYPNLVEPIRTLKYSWGAGKEFKPTKA